MGAVTTEEKLTYIERIKALEASRNNCRFS